MRSIERRFNQVGLKKPLASSYSCFFMAIEGQKLTKGMISRWFNKLVEKDDYDPKDKREIIKFLVKASNKAEDDKI